MNTIKLKIGTRLGLAFGIMQVLTITLGVVSQWGTNLMKDSYEFVSTNTLSSVRTMNNMSSALEAMRRSELRLTTLAMVGKEKEEGAFNDATIELKKNNDAYVKENVAEGKTKTYSDAFNAKLAYYLGTHRKLVEMDVEAGSDMNKQDAVADYLYYGDNFKANNEARDALKESVAYSYELADAHRQDAMKSYRNAFSSMWCFAALAIVVGVMLSIWITRNLLKQLGCEPDTAMHIAGRIAEGDLSTAIDVKKGDQSSLLFALNAMRDSIVEIVTQVRHATDTITTGSQEIAAGNMDLSARTEAQAGALEETASSMRELTSTVKHNADNARQANQLAKTASEIAVKGGSVVSQVVDTMGSINESAKKIVDIISVIDGIAFQTNILALNAAVEAARAGEQGRGFAVVAAEVRTLAQRSAGAAKEIKNLIGDSVEKVEAGNKLVDQAGSIMGEVVASIRRVTDIVSEITAASDEQTAGIEQVNQAIIEMDNVTQKNVVLVEEAAATASTMQDQAANLTEVVSIFNLSVMQMPATVFAVAPSSKIMTKPKANAGICAQPTTAFTRTAGTSLAVVRPTVVPHENVDGWEEF